MFCNMETLEAPRSGCQRSKKLKQGMPMPTSAKPARDSFITLNLPFRRASVRFGKPQARAPSQQMSADVNRTGGFGFASGSMQLKPTKESRYRRHSCTGH